MRAPRYARRGVAHVIAIKLKSAYAQSLAARTGDIVAFHTSAIMADKDARNSKSIKNIRNELKTVHIAESMTTRIACTIWAVLYSYRTELHYIELLYCKIKSLCTEVHCKNYGNLTKKNNEMRSTGCLSQSSVENNCVGRYA